MSEQDLFYLLALLKVDGVGDIMAKKLLTHCGNAEAVFTTKINQIAAIDGVGSTLLKNLKTNQFLKKPRKNLNLFVRMT